MPLPRRRAVDYRIDPFDLHLFAAVVEHGTITGAAAAVHLSLAAASARIKALETATGARLLDRSKAGVTPTDAGRALARQARRVLAEVESLHVEMAAFGSGLRGTVRMVCNTAALAAPLLDALGPFLAANVDLDLDVQELPSDAALDALRSGIGDIAIVADYVETTGLVVHPWRDDRLVALLPPRWLPGHRRAVAFADLLEHPLVGLPRESGLARYLAACASRSGRIPRHRVRLASFDAIAQMVAAGVGSAIVPESASHRFREQGGRVMALSDPWARRKLSICTTPEGAALSGVRSIVEALGRA